jgi:hypothetical protein
LIHRTIFHAIVPILAAHLLDASIPVEIPGRAIFRRLSKNGLKKEGRGVPSQQHGDS